MLIEYEREHITNMILDYCSNSFTFICALGILRKKSFPLLAKKVYF